MSNKKEIVSKDHDLKNPAFQTNESFEDLLNESNFDNIDVEGKVIEVVVKKIENGVVILDAGLKSEAAMPIKEFAEDNETPNVNIGDKFEVYVEKIENSEGRLVLSREKAIRESAWKELEKISEEGSTVEGSITSRIKGGFVVTINKVAAFLPGSQVDVKPVKDISFLINIKQPFKVLKMDKRQGNIVVSRRAIIEELRKEERDEMLSKVEEGQILKGTVKNITDYGAFIDLGSVDGLLHVTDISWNRVAHPSEKLQVGQEVEVQVIKYNEDTKRISLGMKQLSENPWLGIDVKYAIGSKHKAVISSITDYGAFAELETGIEGLIHVSEISWTKLNHHPKKLVKIGEEYEVVILDIDITKHRISLGIKQCYENPWLKFSEEHQVGEIIKGHVRNITEFGIFVNVDKEIDGLIHFSDVSWDESKKIDTTQFKPEEEIEVKILSIDVERQRISLGIKQLDNDPLEEIFEQLSEKSIVTCTVSALFNDGLEIVIKDKLTCFIKKGELSMSRVEQRIDRFAVGDRVDALVTKINKEKRSISLSIRALEENNNKEAIKNYGSADSGASLADILSSAMNKHKKDNE